MTEFPAIQLVGVRKGYREGDRDHVVLDGVDVAVGKGERVAVLGPSGSGKSTLLNLVSGIDLPDEGTVTVAGVELTSLSERDRTLFRREHLGFVFQFFNLIPTLTVLENLLLPLELLGRAGDTGTERARSLLDAVDLGGRASSYPDRLSGGEQQRVAVARAIVHRPSLVLADEPTGNLDEDTGARVVALLDDLVARDGITLVAVTHARELAARMDRILRVRHGQVVPDAS
jgi:putative ABC transport system ATP-binding protein